MGNDPFPRLYVTTPVIILNRLDLVLFIENTVENMMMKLQKNNAEKNCQQL